MFNPTFEKISLSCDKRSFTDTIKAECKTDVLADDIFKILCVTPFVTLKNKELADGKINYTGKITFYISYISNNKAIRKCECGEEFSGSIPSDADIDSTLFVSFDVDKTETELGAYLLCKSYITVKATTIFCVSDNILTGGENLVTKQDERSLLLRNGSCQGVYPLEEEFSLPYSVSEVIYHRLEGVITAVQCGVGCVICDGEGLLSLIMLQTGDKKDIIKEERVFPFRMEISCDNAMPSMIATARVFEKSFNTDISVDSEKGSSLVKISASLNFNGEIYSENTISLIADLFSTEKELAVTSKDIAIENVGDIRSYNEMISLKGETAELPSGTVVVAVADERATITSMEIADNKLDITGVINFVCFMKDGDNEVFTRKFELPFTKTFDGMFSDKMTADAVIKVYKSNLRILSKTEYDFDCELFVTCYPQERETVRVITDIKEMADKVVDDTAIKVFIPMADEELWTLSKRLNVCPDQLVATNRDLNFPLTGKERIVVYTQK